MESLWTSDIPRDDHVPKKFRQLQHSLDELEMLVYRLVKFLLFLFFLYSYLRRHFPH